jgi:hypothetical protein
MTGKPALKESDLYPPLRDFLVAQGYRVRSEVAGCDVTAVIDDQLVVIEIKRALNLDLLTQGLRRQRTADSVYLAIPAPRTETLRKRHLAVIPVVKRLELGLILVDLESVIPVRVAFHPIPYRPRLDRRARRALVREQAARSVDGNTGGTRATPLLTAYREKALTIALLLKQNGPSRPRDLRDGGGPKTQSILSHNVYGWFERIDRGVYDLSTKGAQGLSTYAPIVELLAKKLG